MPTQQAKSAGAKHKSESSAQRSAERALIAGLNRSLGLSLSSQEGKIAGIELDGLDRERRAMCEAYAHIGPVKGSQPDKVAGDILKMLYAEKLLGGHWRKLLCFADGKAARILTGRSWLAEAARSFDIEVQVVPLPENVQASVKAAQDRQVMVNK
jgi:hypothetical protein